MSTWEEIGEKWNNAQQAAEHAMQMHADALYKANLKFNQLGFEAIMKAVEVGEDLQQKKLETPHGEWGANLTRVLNLNPAPANMMASRLMRLALHRDLIEHHKPASMRSALKLLPSPPRKTSERKVAEEVEEVNELESFAKKTAREQAKVLAAKEIKAELHRLQNQAHDAVKTEMEALRKQLEEERKRVAELLAEAREKKQFYEDLINRRTNGHDFKKGMKLLRQMAHPDRESTSSSLRAKAMHELDYIGRFLGV